MRQKAPIGKKNFAGKKFKSAKPNELNASDKNVIRNNISEFTKQQLAFRIGKPVTLVEKFIKKEGLIEKIEIQEEKSLNNINELLIAESTENNLIGLAEVKVEKERKNSEKVQKKINFIKENHQKYNAFELADKLNIAVRGVRYYLKKLNLKPVRKVRVQVFEVSKNEAFIKENHKEYTAIELSEILNCSCFSVRHYLSKLKIKALRVSKSKAIPPETIQFLRVNYRTMTAREMSDALGNIKWRQVTYLCEKHGFLKTPEETEAIKKRWNKIIFEESEEKYIIENHGEIKLAEIAKNIGRTRSSVVNFLTRKGKKITMQQQGRLIKNSKAMKKAKEKEDAVVL